MKRYKKELHQFLKQYSFQENKDNVNLGDLNVIKNYFQYQGAFYRENPKKAPYYKLFEKISKDEGFIFGDVLELFSMYLKFIFGGLNKDENGILFEGVNIGCIYYDDFTHYTCNPEIDFRNNNFLLYEEILENIIQKYRSIIGKNSFTMEVKLPIELTPVLWHNGEKFEQVIPNNNFSLELTEFMQCNLLNNEIIFKYHCIGFTSSRIINDMMYTLIFTLNYFSYLGILKKNYCGNLNEQEMFSKERDDYVKSLGNLIQIKDHEMFSYLGDDRNIYADLIYLLSEYKKNKQITYVIFQSKLDKLPKLLSLFNNQKEPAFSHIDNLYKILRFWGDIKGPKAANTVFYWFIIESILGFGYERATTPILKERFLKLCTHETSGVELRQRERIEFKKTAEDFFDILYTQSRCTIVHGLDFKNSKLFELPENDMKKVAENIVDNYIKHILKDDLNIF